MRNERHLLSLREVHQEIFNRGNDEESHLDDGEESCWLADREGTPHAVTGAALQDVQNALTKSCSMRSDNYLNVNEGDQADVGHDIVNRAMEEMSENNNILAQDILLENDEGSKCEDLIFYCLWCGDCIHVSVLNRLNNANRQTNRLTDTYGGQRSTGLTFM